jgi:hypothetical protein
MAVETYEVTFSGVLAGQFVQTVQHVKATIATPVNPFASALLIIQDINNNGLLDAWMAILPDVYTLTSMRCRRVSGTGGATAIIVGGDLTTTTGQRAGGISSAQVSPLIIWIGTTLPDKTGRLFVPGVSESDIQDMQLVAGLLTDMNLFITAWIAGGTVGSVDTYEGAIYRRTPAIATDVIFAGQVSPLIGTQRRRLRPV